MSQKSKNPLARLARSGALLLLLFALTAAPGYASEKLKVGDPAPPKLTWNVKLSDYRGRVVVIAFWASWCPPCRQELAMLANLQKAATRKKVMIFAVDFREDDEVLRRVQRALYGFDLTLISDSAGTLGRKYDVDAIPHMVVIGRDGRIAAIHLGYDKSEIPTLVNEINSLWSAPAASAPQSPSALQPTSKAN